jgi:hypothetical protein
VSNSWIIIKGGTSILIVAGHNFPHVRKSRIKIADSGTGMLATLLCERLNAFGIVSTEIQKDPNWYIRSPFRIEVKNLIEKYSIKTVIDLHARRPSWPREIDFYPNDSFQELYKQTLKDLSIRTFKNDEQLTLSEDLDRTRTPSLEIEIRSNMLIKNSLNYDKIVSLIEKVIKNIT